MSTAIDASTEDAVTRWRRQIGARKPYRRQLGLAVVLRRLFPADYM